MTEKQTSVITYRKPPLVEVVCGIQFEAVAQFNIGHIGKLWDSAYSSYPECVELVPLTTPLEPLPQALADIPMAPTLMARAGFLAADNSAVIQVQRDAFYYNWRKKNESEDYPRYEQVMARFENEFALFVKFIEKLSGKIKPLQYELTYLNEIPIKQEYEGLQVLQDARWENPAERYLSPEMISLDCSFLVLDGRGRLRTKFKNTLKEDGTFAYQWSLTVRGATIPREEMSTKNMREWFNEARECIVRSFADLSDKQFQEAVWERIYD